MHSDHDWQVNILEARYRVRGVDAAGVEDYLAATFGMGHLDFLCCGWESPRHGWFSLPDAYAVHVSMGSGETLHSSRAEWALIPWFHVIVEFYLEEP